MEVNLTKPNSGRMVDYRLGGQHNFEIDRQACRAIDAIAPWSARTQRENRNFMRRACTAIAQRAHLTSWIDFGSGLPTQGNLHEVLPDARVLYSDVDPIAVQYGKDIVAGNPLVRYEWADARRPLDLVGQPENEAFLGTRRIGVLMTGLMNFLRDDELRQALAELYDWCAPGSHLVFTLGNTRLLDLPGAVQLYNSTVTPLFLRASSELEALLGPWQLTGEGLSSLVEWGIPGFEGDIPPGVKGSTAGVVFKGAREGEADASVR